MATTLSKAIGVAKGIDALRSAPELREMQQQQLDTSRGRLGLDASKFAANQKAITDKQMSEQKTIEAINRFQESDQTDMDALSDAYLNSPDLAKSFLERVGIVNETQGRQAGQFMLAMNQLAVQDDKDAMLDLARQRQQSLQAQGRDTTETSGMIESLANNDLEKVKNAIKVSSAGLRGAGILDQSQYEIIAGKGSSKSSSQSEFEYLTQDLTDEQKDLAKKIKLGIKPRAVSNAIITALKNGDIADLAEAKAELKEAEKFAEATGSSRAKIIDSGFASMRKIDESISNIDNAIRTLEGGAGTGAVEKFLPSVKAASVELDNIRGKMALDVVGATTFGALSKGELDLAKDIALPTGLNKSELLDYLKRKKDSQSKLRSYYNEQIQHLDQGGTVASFLRMKENETPSQDAEYEEGMTATGPNGERAVYTNGEWVIQ